MRWTCITVALVALALTGAGCSSVGAGRSAGAATVGVDPDRHGPIVPRSFLGLSIEWDSVVPYTGPAHGRHEELPALLAPIARAAHGPLALRIGGDTGDQAWWNPDGRPRPPTVLQDISPATLDAVAWLTRSLGAPLTLGVNLALDDPANALALVRAAQRRLPPASLAAIEIGNEPDLYTHAHTFRRGGHVHRRVRKRVRYGPSAYGRDTARYLRALTAGLQPTPRLVVGGLAGPGWWPALGHLLDRWAPRAGAVAGHLYALPDCAAPTPSAAWLMSPAASRGRVESLSALFALARARGLRVRVSELNSAACGGRPGLSDTAAGALWLTDTLFALLQEGAAGADVHTWQGAAYAPFAVTARGTTARPALMGMLTFARAAPAGSRLVGVDISGRSAMRAWATVDRRRMVRVALLAPAAATARLRATRCARLWRPHHADVRICGRGGRLSITLPARSMAVVTMPARERSPASR